MKKVKILISIIIFFTVSPVFATTVNGRIITVENTGLVYKIKIQLNSNTGMDDIGGSTLILEYDPAELIFPDAPVDSVNYVFHNFYGGNYGPATVSKAFENKIWINVDLLNKNSGLIVSDSGGWTDVVTLYFEKQYQNQTPKISWCNNDIYWSIFNGDNSTQCKAGKFEVIEAGTQSGNDEIPINYELFQNYPNPFNPSTKIKFSLIQQRIVRLKVYNIIGEEVAKLVDDIMNAGYHEVDFNASGNGLASGVYFYRLAAEDPVSGNIFVQTKKMILVK